MKMTPGTIRRCVICANTREVEGNHVGGRNHVAWFTSPLCREHHERFHTLLRQAGVDLRYTPNPLERLRRALSAIKIMEWMLLEAMKYEIETKGIIP